MISEEQKKKWDHRIEYLKNRTEHLSDWELSFVDSIDARRSAQEDLTFSQVQKLYQIYHKVNEEVSK